LEKFIESFKKDVDRKYNTILCRFTEKLTHPKREEETTLGNLVADVFSENAGSDVMLVGSGSIRVKELGPVVTLKDYLATFPYDDSIKRFEITGTMLRRIFNHIMRIENRDGEGECYQVNSSVRAIYSDKEKKLISLKINGKEVENSEKYSLAIQNFHFNNSLSYLNVSSEELLKSGKEKVVTTSAQEVLEEYLRINQNITRKIEGRIVYQ
jgi:5'-nucleotidase / UDP-sugar diphosphatase